MKLEEVFEKQSPKEAIQALFDSHKDKIYTSSQVATALKGTGGVNFRNISGSLTGFPSVLVGTKRVYGHRNVIKKVSENPILLDQYRPVRYWIDKVFQKFPLELFQPKEIADRLQTAFNIKMPNYSLRTNLSERTSVVIGVTGRGYYGTKQALDNFRKELRRRGTEHTTRERGGSKCRQ